MIVTLCTERIRTLDDIRAFLGGNEAADITPHGREAAYAFIERALVRFRYHLGLSRAGKGLVREFLAKVTGYSDSQLSRLIAQQRRTGRIRDHRLRPPARPFATVYITADAVLPTEVDEAFGQLSGPATKRILWRQYHVFGDERFERLAEISNGHIYNLRGRRAYRSARTTFRATRGAISPVGAASWLGLVPILKRPPSRWRSPHHPATFRPCRSCSPSVERNRLMARTKRVRRSYSAGEWGRNRVRVFPDPETGLFQIEWRENGRTLSRSLGHRDWARAKKQADEFAAGFNSPEFHREAPTEPEPLTWRRCLTSTATRSPPPRPIGRGGTREPRWRCSSSSSARTASPQPSPVGTGTGSYGRVGRAG